jgi:hypothetical protein
LRERVRFGFRPRPGEIQKENEIIPPLPACVGKYGAKLGKIRAPTNANGRKMIADEIITDAQAS